MFKKYYQRFLAANPGVQHFAAHSHHYWPDVTREAMMQYWDDSARFVDDKWNHFFSTRVPETQRLISEILNLSHPEQIVFAPNTHEFVFRILSCFEPAKPLKVLTTDSEFYSFDRQISRLSENQNWQVEKVPTQPFQDFKARFTEKIKSAHYDLIFLSHVFFNSGVVAEIHDIVNSVKSQDTVFVIDGYHGFMAVPTNLKSIEDRVFYVAGSYKYAQAGEGCCFMHVPRGSKLRPAYTGWFASFSSLSSKNRRVEYSDDGMRFAGSTMDYSGLYRLHAVLQLLKTDGISVDHIHSYIQSAQLEFKSYLKKLNHPLINETRLLQTESKDHGHFYTFELEDEKLTRQLYDFLQAHKIRTDYRGSRLRFGFGLYQDRNFDLSCLSQFNQSI